jgi:hypothetical protein
MINFIKTILVMRKFKISYGQAKNFIKIYNDMKNADT